MRDDNGTVAGDYVIGLTSGRMCDPANATWSYYTDLSNKVRQAEHLTGAAEWGQQLSLGLQAMPCLPHVVFVRLNALPPLPLPTLQCILNQIMDWILPRCAALHAPLLLRAAPCWHSTRASAHALCPCMPVGICAHLSALPNFAPTPSASTPCRDTGAGSPAPAPTPADSMLAPAPEMAFQRRLLQDPVASPMPSPSPVLAAELAAAAPAAAPTGVDSNFSQFMLRAVCYLFNTETCTL